MEELIETGLDNVFLLEGSKKLVTRNLVPGKGDRLLKIADAEYRIWDPYRSKLAAMVLKGSGLRIKDNFSVLYLGAANGTTASHVSDIVSQGIVFAVEFSPRAMQDLIRISMPRLNLIPILADARHPDSYKHMVTEVDMVYQDIAQREQARIALMNAEMFLKRGGILVLIIKSRSIDAIKKTREVANSEVSKLEGIFKIKESINLEPFHHDHIAVVAQKI